MHDDYVSRMLVEETELYDKIKNLTTFINNNINTQVIDDEPLKLLQEQLKYMCLYHITLKRRIEMEYTK